MAASIDGLVDKSYFQLLLCCEFVYHQSTSPKELKIKGYSKWKKEELIENISKYAVDGVIAFGEVIEENITSTKEDVANEVVETITETITENIVKSTLSNMLINQETADYIGDGTPLIKGKKIYPNDSCPCGSGKKFKKCCKNR